MASTPETGFLVIADLTGYTAYLAQSELEHAPTIAGDLLETVVGRLDPPFRLAKFEGDAAFLSVEDGRADGSLLLDAVEASYLAFRRRLRSIDQATTCDCNSCALAPKLDLKLFVHHGSYVRTTIAGRDELAGSDVIVVHRLLKGTTAEASRANGFALFTAAAIDALGLDAAALGLAEAAEAIDHLGTVTTFTLDLEARWAVERQARRMDVGDGDRVVDLDAIVPAEPADVWAHLTSPELRTLWEGPLEIVESSPSGRRGVGTQAQCVTGRLATLEEIVDWQPYDHVGWRIAVPALGPIGATADLEPVAGGTHVTVRWAYQGEGEADPLAVQRVRAEREAAFARLTGRSPSLPVVDEGGNGMTSTRHRPRSRVRQTKSGRTRRTSSATLNGCPLPTLTCWPVTEPRWGPAGENACSSVRSSGTSSSRWPRPNQDADCSGARRPALRHAGRPRAGTTGRHRCERGTTALRRCTDVGGSCPRSSRWKAPPA